MDSLLCYSYSIVNFTYSRHNDIFMLSSNNTRTTIFTHIVSKIITNRFILNKI